MSSGSIKPQTILMTFKINNKMREGAYIGALVAFIVYFMLPIYGDNGVPATIVPTGNAVSDPTSFNQYVSNLPFSMLIFFALEILGISIGIAAQMIFRKNTKNL